MTGPTGGKRRQLTPQEKWQVFLEVTSREITQADAARKWAVDVSTIIKIRKTARDASLAAFASAQPGRPRSAQEREIDLLKADNARLADALKELAIELTLARGKARWVSTP
jgi:transposase